MGTLTGNSLQLPDYCDHKLPTSCRLTATPKCCACADLRVHAPSYSTYIDGVGFVTRATRWHRYCWFCKVFWDNRVAASGIRPVLTRIPENPDQHEFLNRWYEFYRGYRIITGDNGHEQRVAVIGEPFKDVSPGHLPRTLEQLRANRQRDDGIDRLVPSPESNIEPSNGPESSLDDVLGNLLEQAEAEEVTTAAAAVAAEDPTHQVAPEASATPARGEVQLSAQLQDSEYAEWSVPALRSELVRLHVCMERAIAGLLYLGDEFGQDELTSFRDLGTRLRIRGENDPDTVDELCREMDRSSALIAQDVVLISTNRHATSQTIPSNTHEQRVAAAEVRLNRAFAARVNAEGEIGRAEGVLRALERERRTNEAYRRLFGTREEMEAAGDAYESPIGGMFERAWTRYHNAEEQRRQESTLHEVLAAETAVEGLSEDGNSSHSPRTSHLTQLEEYHELLARQEAANLTHHMNPRGSQLDRPSPLHDSSGHSLDAVISPFSLTPNQIDLLISNILPIAQLDNLEAPLHPELARQLQAAGPVPAGMINGELYAIFRRWRRASRRADPRMFRQADQHIISAAMRVALDRGYDEFVFSIPEPGSSSSSDYGNESDHNEHSHQTTTQPRAAADNTHIERTASLDISSGHSPTPFVSPFHLTQSQVMELTSAILGEPHQRRDVHAPLDPDWVTRLQAVGLSPADTTRANLDAVFGRWLHGSFGVGYPDHRAADVPIVAAAIRAAIEHGGADYLFPVRAADLINVDADESRGNATSDAEVENEERPGPLDRGTDGRPAPLAEGEMTRHLPCRICFTQLADIACLPCGHTVMCRWCAAIHIPVSAHDHTLPARGSNASCPVCRRRVKRRVRVFAALD